MNIRVCQELHRFLTFSDIFAVSIFWLTLEILSTIFPEKPITIVSSQFEYFDNYNIHFNTAPVFIN